MSELLRKEWGENEIDFEKASPNRRYNWICNKGHEWSATLGNRKYQNTGCPYCNSKKPSIDNNLLIKYPEISSEWDYDKNDLNPSDFLPNSAKKAHWICNKGHRWEATISNRTRQNNKCPICFKNESWCENYIYSVLSTITEVSKLKSPEIDIYLNSINVGIEYDGYYHKFRYDKDILKNKWASKNLKLLIRVGNPIYQNFQKWMV